MEGIHGIETYRCDKVNVSGTEIVNIGTDNYTLNGKDIIGVYY